MTDTENVDDRAHRLANELMVEKAAKERVEKLLAQAIERSINPPVILEKLDQEYLDQCCDDAIRFTHKAYRKIFGQLYWKRDLSL